MPGAPKKPRVSRGFKFFDKDWNFVVQHIFRCAWLFWDSGFFWFLIRILDVLVLCEFGCFGFRQDLDI
jgi:hypothetical protein